MKRTDIVSIAIIAGISMVVAYVVAQALIGSPTGKQSAKVRTAEPISAHVDQPDPAVFNSNAINPTVEVVVGEGAAGNGVTH